jgi:RNA polymerase sigma-70 factor, ECF subfamily
MTDSSDIELVESSLKGNKRAFGVLVERYHEAMYRTAYGIVKDMDLAKDVVQNSFIKSWEKLDTYKVEQKFFSWLYRIVVNESLNNERARKRHEELQNQFVNEETPYHRLSEAERKSALMKSIEELPSIYKTVIQLRHFEEMSYAEISELLNIDQKTVKSRLYTARMQLREKYFRR